MHGRVDTQMFSIILTLFVTHIAHAGGAVGNPGNGGGGGGGAQTRYGYGWYKFNTNGAGTGAPGAMKSGNWANVQATCAAAKASTITAFIVETPRRTIASSVVYTYVDQAHNARNYYGTYPLYHGNDGGYWQSYAQAKASFDALPANGVSTAGYTFGSNVGYFCSDFAPNDYNLIPTISGTPTFTDGDSTGTNQATLSPAVNNSGSSPSDGSSQWRVVHFNSAPGAPIPGGGDSGSAPEQFYGHGAVAIASGTGVTFPRNVTNLSVASQVIGDFPIGSRICYALSVQPLAQNNNNWRHSTPFCVTIAKSPKFQVHGGDIRVGSNFADQTVTPGSNIITSQTTKNR
jgi:hypothetical protein